MTKCCTRCRQAKPAADFAHNRAQADGLASWCRNCHRDYRASRKAIERDSYLRSKYGISSEEHGAILEAQGGGCAICGEPPGAKPLAVDHCHDTGAVRGLLCGRCNMGIGMFLDDTTRMAAAISYLDSRR